MSTNVLDLKLLCADGASVMVSCDKLSNSTHSPAIKDILAKLREEHPGVTADAPMELELSQDTAVPWQVVSRVIEQPMARLTGVLTVVNLEAVIRLADKYQLITVLQACETFIFATFASITDGTIRQYSQMVPGQTDPFGVLKIDSTLQFPLQLPFLELLYRTGMRNAFDLMTRLFASAWKAYYIGDVKVNVMHGQRLAPNTTPLRGALSAYMTTSTDMVSAAHVMHAITDLVLVAVGSA